MPEGHCALMNLSDKLQNASRTVVMEKRREKELIQEKLENTQSILANQKKIESEALDHAKSTCDQVAKLCNETIKGFAIKTRKENQICQNIKDQAESELQDQQREHESRVEEIIERQTESMTACIQSLGKKAKTINQKNHKSVSDVNRLINNLERDLQEEKENRELNCRRIKDDVLDQITKFHTDVEKQQEKRGKSHIKLSQMMDEISLKLNYQIDEQAKSRKQNNQAILKLIEGACERLQQKMQI